MKLLSSTILVLAGVGCASSSPGRDAGAGGTGSGQGGSFVSAGGGTGGGRGGGAGSSATGGSAGTNTSSTPGTLPALPEGNSGIASRYPGDVGIAGDSAVIFADGKLTMDFPNLRLRDVPSLTIDRFALCFHIGSNPNGQSKKWYDNVVAAKSYIGPMMK